MDTKQMEQNIDDFTKQELDRVKQFYKDLPDNSEEDVVIEKPVDFYKTGSKRRKDFASEQVRRGTSTLTKEIALEELEKLAKIKKRAEADAKYWEMRGDKERAQMTKDQYIEDNFLPSVEMVVIASTPDEVLNAKEILKQFDDLSMQYGPGYTASYIRTAYGDKLGNVPSQSDGYVRSMVERIKFLSASDKIRTAYGVAKKVKDEIDRGDHIAGEDDYEIITRVSSIG